MVMILRSTEQYHALLRTLAGLGGDEPLAIDTETSGLRPWVDTELRGISLAWADQSVYVPVSHPESWNVPNPALLGEVLNSRCWATPIVMHNRNFDTAILERGIGMRPREGAGSYWDTAVIDWLLEENLRHGLKPIAARLWGEDETAEQTALKALMKGETQAEAYKRLRQTPEFSGKGTAEACRAQAKIESAASKRGWGDLTADEIGPYACKDAELTLRLYHWQQTAPGIDLVRPAIDREFAVQECVYRLTKLGIKIDRTQVLETQAKYRARIAEIEAEFAGTNLGSAPQLAALVYGYLPASWNLEILERTKTGAPSVGKDALDLHEGAHPLLDRILEYRKLQKADSTYFSAMLENADENDRVHTSLNQIGTTTGRFSSSAPPLQNIPRDGTNSDVRDIFVAEPGFELWSFDMSQAELRIAASLANEPSMLDRFLAAEDIYQGTADSLGIPRQKAKIVVLSSGYGIGARKLARGLFKGTGRQPSECEYWLYSPDDRRELRLQRCHACDVCETKTHLDNYWGSVPFLGLLNRRLIDFAEKNRYVPLHVPGRRRHYPTNAECRRLKIAKWPKPYTALNSVIQGGCAELVKDWLLVVEPRLNKLGCRLVLTVHDSIVVEIPIGMKDAVEKVVQVSLDKVTPKGWINVPVESKLGV